MAEPTDGYGFRIKPQRAHDSEKKHLADDTGWFYEERGGISVYIGPQDEDDQHRPPRHVSIPAKALRRWAEVDAKRRSRR